MVHNALMANNDEKLDKLLDYLTDLATENLQKENQKMKARSDSSKTLNTLKNNPKSVPK
jgi:hypothetical protein